MMVLADFAPAIGGLLGGRGVPAPGRPPAWRTAMTPPGCSTSAAGCVAPWAAGRASPSAWASGVTKTLAKTANRAARRPQPGTGWGCSTRTAEGRRTLAQLPCGSLWGIGRRLAAGLAALRIHTAGDLARANRAVIRKRLRGRGRAHRASNSTGFPAWVWRRPSRRAGASASRVPSASSPATRPNSPRLSPPTLPASARSCAAKAKPPPT